MFIQITSLGITQSVNVDKISSVEKEFRQYLYTSDKLITIISQNSEALNRNSKAFEQFSDLFEKHTKAKS